MLQNIRKFKNIFPTLGKQVYIDPSAVVIGMVELGDDVSVWPTTVLRGDSNKISIGKCTNIQDGTVIHVSSQYPVSVGESVTIGHKAIIHGCHIESHCLIGMGALILDGVYIEHHVMVGAGSIVSPGKRLESGYLYVVSPGKRLESGYLYVVSPGKRLESGYLYVGVPARQIRKLTEAEYKTIEESAKHYVKYKTYYDE